MSKWIERIQGLPFWSTLRDSGVYFLGFALVQILSLVSLPVYTHYLSEGEVGTVNTLWQYANILFILFSFNVDNALSRYYYEKKGDFSAFLATILGFALMSFSVFTLVIICFQDYFAQKANLPTAFIPYMLIIALGTLMLKFFTQLNNAQKKSFSVIKATVLSQYAKFALAFGLILYYKDAAGLQRLRGESLALLLFTFFALFYFFRKMQFAPKKEHLKYALSYSLPLVPLSLSSVILAAFDQVYINGSIGNDEAGLYSFAYKVGLLLNGVYLVLNNASNPYFYGSMKKFDDQRESNPQAAKKILYKVHSDWSKLIKLYLLGAVALILFGQDMGYVLASKASFLQGLDMVPILLLGYVFFGLSNFNSRLLLHYKKNTYALPIVFIPGIVNIILNVYCLSIWGYKAAAYTTLLSFILMYILSHLIIKYHLRLPILPLISFIKELAYLALFLMIFYGLDLSAWSFSIKNLVAKALIGIAFASMVLYPMIKELLEKRKLSN